MTVFGHKSILRRSDNKWSGKGIMKENTPKESLERISNVVGLTLGPTHLPDDVLEKLYRSYSLKQKRSGLACFIAASIVFDLWAIIVPQGQSVETYGELNSLDVREIKVNTHESTKKLNWLRDFILFDII